MASLSFLLGMVPSTEKVESADDNLRAEYKAYKDFENSDDLKHYLDLEKEVKSNAFKVRKKRMKKGEYRDSEEFQKETEYQVLKKSEKILWYYKTKKKYPFKEIERWDLTFDEKFNEGELDKSRWMTRSYWGELSMNEPYALEDDKSLPTEGSNIDFYDNKARIVTKAEKKEGLVWRSEQGFVREDFDFTSGMISTAKSFKQKYGVFNAKIKMAGGSVSQAFWMVSDTMLPHIDVARFENGKFYSNFFWGGPKSTRKSLSKTGGTKYGDEYFIYTLEWTPNKLTWKINGKVFKTQTSGVPQEEMCINFSSNLKKDADEGGLPSAMEIDWVRVYKLKQKK